MTRRRLNLILYISICAVLALGGVMAWAKFSEGQEALFELLTHAAPLVVGVAAAVLANAFQKRSAFVGFLRDEWYNIVETKTELICFCRSNEKTPESALEAWSKISMAIDRMRILYRNVGETDELIGYYPYAPLHDMRWAIERGLGVKDPLKDALQDPRALDTDWRLVENRVWTAFAALREVFLEELQLQEPDYPVLGALSERRKRPGADAKAAERRKRALLRRKSPPTDPLEPVTSDGQGDPRAHRDAGDSSRDRRIAS